jgi:hypothetical protein
LIQEEDTVYSKNIKSGEVLNLLTAGGGRMKPIHWLRAKKMTGKGTEEDYDGFKFGPDRGEGIVFKAKVDCHFCGVLWNRHYEDKAFSVKLAYRTRATERGNVDVGDLSEYFQFNSQDCEEFTITWADRSVNGQPQFIMDFQDKGEKPVFVAAGTCIELSAKTDSRESYNICYNGQER